MSHFKDYDSAKTDAQKRADALKNYDFGLEKIGGGYSVFMLPSPERRCGHELRCEVVRPTVPGDRYKW